MRCTDPSLTYLNDLGYNVIRQPREGIEPLQLIGKQAGQVALLGTVDQLLADPPDTLPEVTRDQAMAGVLGQRTASLTMELGVKLLGQVLAAMGAGQVGASLGFGGAGSLAFQFDEVRLDTAAPLSIGAYLRRARVDEGNPVVAEYARGRGALFLLTEVMRSRSIVVHLEIDDSMHAGVELPAIEQLLDGKVDVEAVEGRSEVLRFTGPRPLAFGFKALKLGVRRGRLTVRNARASGAVFLGGGDEPDEEPQGPPPALIDDEPGLLDLDGPDL